jgi:hypothetical protein
MLYGLDLAQVGERWGATERQRGNEAVHFVVRKAAQLLQGWREQAFDVVRAGSCCRWRRHKEYGDVEQTLNQTRALTR